MIRPAPHRAAAALLLATGLALAGCQDFDFSPRFEKDEIDIFDDLFSVSVVDDQRAVAVGYHGAVYWTADGGETWSKGITPSNRLLYSVSMADAQRGWAVGQLGTILRTEDGGASWTLQPNLKIDEGSHLFGVHALDPERAWAVGEWGSRIWTSDGGKTWEDESITIDLQHPMFVWLDLRDQEKVRKGEKVYEDVGLNYITCLRQNTDRCWIVGEFGYIFHSEDGGRSWSRGQILGEVRVDPMSFGYNEIALPQADRERLRRFAGEIEDQTHLNVEIDPFVSEKEVADLYDPEDPFPIFDIIEARIDETKGVLEGAGVLLDRLRIRNKPPWDYEDFVENDPEFLERYIRERTREEPIVRVSVIQNPYLFTVHFQDEKQGLISGLGGVVLRSEDGGRSWSYHTTQRKQALFSVATADGRAIAVGEKGFVQVSTDGGSSWRAPRNGSFPTVFTFMRDLGFDASRRVGFIVGQEGMVLKSRDSGATWSQILPPPDRRASSAIF